MRRLSVFLLAIGLMAGAANAQDLDWDLNNFDIFFDETAATTATTAAVGSVVEAYVVVLKPDLPLAVTSWELRGLRRSTATMSRWQVTA